MTALVSYLLLFVSGLLYASFTAFRGALTEGEAPSRDEDPLPFASLETLAAFLVGLGGAGAMLTHEGRLTAALRFGLATVVGFLVAALVAALVNGFLLEKSD